MKVLKLGLAVVLGLGVVLGAAWFLVPREYQPCTACNATGSRACGAVGCVNGRVKCPAPCLKREDPGWKVSTNPHFPPGTLTQIFRNGDGTYGEVSQGHIGQVMTNASGKWELGPACAQCGGSTRALCPTCQGKKPCLVCKGKQEVRK